MPGDSRYDGALQKAGALALAREFEFWAGSCAHQTVLSKLGHPSDKN